MVLVASPLCPLGLAITSTSGLVLTLLYYELGIRRPHETHPLTVTFEINLTHTEFELAARPPTSTCTNTSTVMGDPMDRGAETQGLTWVFGKGLSPKQRQEFPNRVREFLWIGYPRSNLLIF